MPFAVLLLLGVAQGAEVDVPQRPIPPDLPKRVQEITDAILGHHIESPSRQEMILAGIRAAHAAAGVAVPSGLAQRASAATTPEQFAALLKETWPDPSAKTSKSADAIAGALIDGMLGSVPGGADFLSAKELKVAEQIEGNLYVGIQVAVSYDGDLKRTVMMAVSEGGPAQRAGVLVGDVIEEIDGKDMKDLLIRDVVDRIRGEEGTHVVIKVHRPKTKESLTFKIRRGRLPRQTIRGLKKRPSGEWDVRIPGPDPIGYLRIDEIVGSTPHELRMIAERLETEGVRALVLDLRTTRVAVLHPTILLADDLLDSGTIGQVREGDKVEVYRADPDALFRGWPLVVLVGGQTAGAGEWLAAALQDNHRASIVGSPTRGDAHVETTVPVGDGSSSIRMTTRLLERSNGRPLANPQAAAQRFRTRVLSPPAGSSPPKGGVIPDYPVTAARQERPERPAVREPEETNVLRDPIVIKAWDLLRKAPKPSESL